MQNVVCKYHQIDGPHIKAARRKAGLTQAAMAQLVGCVRDSVSYWETKRHPLTRGQLMHGVPASMLKVLGIEPCGIIGPVRARGGMGFYSFSAWQQNALDRDSERREAKAAARAAHARVLCQAMTRKGHPCKNKSEPGKKRCKFHGGMSTGPTTIEGKARIAEAQRQRWAAFRASKIG